jgi:hypothetical protein
MENPDCKHNDLKRTADATDAGWPIYYCPAKCGAGLFVVKPMEITVSFGRPTETAPAKEK